jgi:DNA-directed RNA polymerase subunit RPC12/RpoP
MTKGYCPICKKLIIEDLEKYKEEYPEEAEVQCSYCGYLMRLK